MKKIKTIVCGIRFGKFYLEALKKQCDKFEIAGILARGSDKSYECAREYGIPLFRSIDDIPTDIELACVILKAGIMGGNGIEISQKLLQKGINVIHEQPVHYKELASCFRFAKKNNLFFGISNLYRFTDATENFIHMTRKVAEKESIHYINMDCAHQILYSTFGILLDVLDKSRPFSIESVISGKSPFDIIQCSINGVPCTIRVHNEVNPKDPDNYFYLFYKFTIGFETGDLILEDSSGPIFWKPRIFVPHDFKFGEKSYSGFDQRNVLMLQDSSNYQEIFWNDWPDAIRKQLAVVENMITNHISLDTRMQVELYEAQQWHVLMDAIGYPRIKEIKYLGDNNSRLLSNSIFIIFLEKCDLRPLLSNLNIENVKEKKVLMDKACLYSMLFTMQQQGILIKDIQIEKKELYGTLKVGSNNLHIVKRWLRALAENGYIVINGDQYTSHISIVKAEVEEAWEQVKNEWIGSLSDSSVIDYYYANAKKLPELLNNEEKAAYILFPQGKMKLATNFYTNTIMGRFLNLEISNRVCSNIEEAEKITVLELGGGTGASTELILQYLEDNKKVRYIFTDLSNFFLGAAKNKLNKFTNIEYQILNIDKNFEDQGIGKESVDIIVAAGMMNNAYDIDFSLRNIYNVLRPKGKVYIAEPVEDLLELQISQVFMMTKPVDIRNEFNTTFMNNQQWVNMLIKAGFELLEIIPDSTHSLSVLNQKLFIGRKKG